MSKETHCNSCERENCPQRQEGALCSLNPEFQGLITAFSSRDPLLVARCFIKVIETEMSRYEKAVSHEEVGETETVSFTDKKGNIHSYSRKKRLDNRVTDLASSIIKAGKTISEIINPPKASPLFQQNNQYNLTVNSADAIRSLPEKEQKDILNFIDEKLDADRSA